MKLLAFLRSARLPSKTTTPWISQVRTFQPDYKPRNPSNKPKTYKYPPFYDPYGGPKPPPSEKIINLAERIASLPVEEGIIMSFTLMQRLNHPKLQQISTTQGLDLGSSQGAAIVEDNVEKTKITFDVKLEKFEAAAKIKVIKEVREFTSLGLKKAKYLVEKTTVVLKQGVTKEEANEIIKKLKAIGGVALME